MSTRYNRLIWTCFILIFSLSISACTFKYNTKTGEAEVNFPVPQSALERIPQNEFRQPFYQDYAD